MLQRSVVIFSTYSVLVFRCSSAANPRAGTASKGDLFCTHLQHGGDFQVGGKSANCYYDIIDRLCVFLPGKKNPPKHSRRKSSPKVLRDLCIFSCVQLSPGAAVTALQVLPGQEGDTARSRAQQGTAYVGCLLFTAYLQADKQSSNFCFRISQQCYVLKWIRIRRPV